MRCGPVMVWIFNDIKGTKVSCLELSFGGQDQIAKGLAVELDG